MTAATAVSQSSVDRAIAQIDAQIADIIDAILHEPSFQQLEAAWRGLAYVVERVDFAENVDVVVWSYSRKELQDDFDEHADVTHTRFFRHVYTAEYGQHGGRPYGAVLANWTVSPAPADVALLSRMASVAAMAHAPVLVGAAPELLGVRDWAELQSMTNPAVFDAPAAARWVAFRTTEDSRYIGVVLPRMLLRLGYGEALASGSSRFVYDETLRKGGIDRLWGSAIFAFAVRLADSFAEHRSFMGVLDAAGEPPAALDRHLALGPEYVMPGVDVVLSRRLEQSFAELGLIPLTWDAVGARLRFGSANSVQRPQAYGSGDGGPSATLSHLLGTRFPYLLLACRFAHYLKVLERERIGAHRERAEVERELNDWLGQYVVVTDSPSPATRLRYPLRAARVTVTDVEGSAGVYAMNVQIQPHLRFMRQAFMLAVDGRLDPR